MKEEVDTLKKTASKDTEDIQIRMAKMEYDMQDRLDKFKQDFRNIGHLTPRSRHFQQSAGAYHYNGKRS
eukprot:3566470-Pyramimonas_sp.AAC.1